MLTTQKGMRKEANMINRLDEALRFHSQALGVRAQRGEVLASNIANADTPNYQARDLDFGKALQNALDSANASASAGSSGGALAATSAGHLPGKASAAQAADALLLYRTPQAASIDNNTVNMDVERAKFADNALHYEANLTFLNGQIRTMLSAIQG
jgi:flagellar basal-body rod protein FlgB